MNIVFLDIDGVLNSMPYFESIKGKRNRTHNEIDESKLPLLKRIIEENNATIFSQTINGETNSNYREKLKWEGCDSCTESDLEIVSTNNINIIFKNGYGIKNIDRFFKKDDEIDIIGCDVDACVMAVCFQLWDRDINFKILTDYIYTTASNFTKNDVLKILKRNFGTCVIEDS